MKIYKVYIYCFYIFSIVFSQIISPAFQWKEVFPFFHWNLYSVPSGDYHDYQIYFPQHDCELRTCGFLRPEAKDHEAYFLMQEMGRAFQNKSVAFKDLKNQFNVLIFGEGDVIPYNVYYRSIDPAEFLKSGVVKESQLIGTVHE